MVDPPPPERTIRMYGNRNRSRARLAFHNQRVIINKFEISPALYQKLKEIHLFGKHNEDANIHLINFLKLCETIKVDENTEEDKRLRLFPLSLKDDANEWLNSLPSCSIPL
ncbi:uncharacterized protein [Cicer arietinum]|uniref:uncharacterized protein n=1 Tax=Cicer arietinum TaxID=3827 RepID=UPI003CC59B3D